MSAENITTYFEIATVAILALGIYFRVLRNRSNKILALLPSVAVSLGILGTFVGIYLGLRGFDVEKISESIPQLLEGLKTAFVTSIAGIIASLILKFAYEWKSMREEREHNVQSEDPINLLKATVSAITNLENSSRQIAKVIVACFRSDEEYSLISQLKLIRQEVTDTRREVTESFKTFAEKIAQSNTDALVKALEKVIGDFNVLLNELVSESFKELSTAMVKLTQWQENYRNHVDEMQEKISNLLVYMDDSAKTLHSSAERMANIQDSLKSIDASINSLSISGEDISSHVTNLRLQNESLKESILSIKRIGEDAKVVIPTITESLNNLTEKLESTVVDVTEKLESSSFLVNDFIKKALTEIKNASDLHAESVQKSIETLDNQLEEELKKALNSLGGSMAALSSKFVEDYGPLTERLREIVRMSEQLNA